MVLSNAILRLQVWSGTTMKRKIKNKWRYLWKNKLHFQHDHIFSRKYQNSICSQGIVFAKSVICIWNLHLFLPNVDCVSISTSSYLFYFISGGTFALYSLLCRHANINTIPNQHRTDEELTTYSRNTFDEKSVAAKTKRWLESHLYKRNALLILVLAGTCMMIGDGILTPAISGLTFLKLCIFISFSFHLSCLWFLVWPRVPFSSILHFILFLHNNEFAELNFGLRATFSFTWWSHISSWGCKD